MSIAPFTQYCVIQDLFGEPGSNRTFNPQIRRRYANRNTRDFRRIIADSCPGPCLEVRPLQPTGGQATQAVPTASRILHDIPGIELSFLNERLRTDPAEAIKVRWQAFDAPDPGPGPQFVMQVRE
jgi:hypothetical protein